MKFEQRPGKQAIRFREAVHSRQSERQTQSLGGEAILGVAGAQCARGVREGFARKRGQRGGGGADHCEPFGHSESLGIYSREMEQTLDRTSHFRQSKRSTDTYLSNI